MMQAQTVFHQWAFGSNCSACAQIAAKHECIMTAARSVWVHCAGCKQKARLLGKRKVSLTPSQIMQLVLVYAPTKDL